MKKTVAFDIVGRPGAQGSGELRDEPPVHLAVAVHFHHDLGPGRQGRAIPGDHGRADAAVGRVEDHPEAGITHRFFHEAARFFRTAIVDDENVFNLRPDPRKDAFDMPADAVAGNDNGGFHGTGRCARRNSSVCARKRSKVFHPRYS